MLAEILICEKLIFFLNNKTVEHLAAYFCREAFDGMIGELLEGNKNSFRRTRRHS